MKALDYDIAYDQGKNVSRVGTALPNAHDESNFIFFKPITNYSDAARVGCALDQPINDHKQCDVEANWLYGSYKEN